MTQTTAQAQTRRERQREATYDEIVASARALLREGSDLSLRAVQADPDRPSGLTKGHRACRGCGEALAARGVLDAAWRASRGGTGDPEPGARP